MRLFFTVLAASAVLVMPLASAKAEESEIYDPTFSGKGMGAAQDAIDQESRKQEAQGFKSPTIVNVALVHHEYMDDDQFGLQMSVPDVMSGCFTASPLEYEANFVDPYFLDIKVKKYQMVSPEGPAELQKCDVQNKISSALMVLDKKDIETRGTKEIRFSTDAGRDTYKITISDGNLELTPTSTTVFKPQNIANELNDKMVYSFHDEGTIVLQVPMAKIGEDVSTAIADFAKSRALAPVEGKASMRAKNGAMLYYFKDDKGRFASMIGKDGYGELGKISVPRPYDGENGREQTQVELTVFVTRPGTEL